MSSIAYVNGQYLPLRAAKVSVQDRGFQFGDAVYEVWAVRNGRLRDQEEHLVRLRRSLTELRIEQPMPASALLSVLREAIRQNRVRNGIVYLQVSRGVANRDHTFPSPPVRPTLVVTAKTLDRRAQDLRARTGVRVESAPDIRWARRDIKSVNLLPNVLARQAAKEKGGFEAWLIDSDGYVTEGTASNAWIVDSEGAIRTRPLSDDILHGVTRAVLVRLARDRQMRVVEAPFTLAEACAAREAFITGATNPIIPVIAIDGKLVGAGKPGPIAQALRDLYLGAET